MTRVKICCISSREEAQLAVAAGANALGLVGPMPSGPGVIADELSREIAAHTPPGVSSFLLTSEADAEAVIAHHGRVGSSVIQLVDELKSGNYRQIREALPGIRLVQVIHVLGEASVAEAISLAEEVDGILLDSGNPDLKVKELGGTGRTHDWEVSRKIVEAVSVPVFLAGGLRPDNVREAVRQVRPFGVDLCSGVRTDGHLDPVKLQAFMAAVRGV